METRVRPFTLDPKSARKGRERILDEDRKQRDTDAPGSHDPSGTASARPEDGRREDASRKDVLESGLIRRTD